MSDPWLQQWAAKISAGIKAGTVDNTLSPVKPRPQPTSLKDDIDTVHWFLAAQCNEGLGAPEEVRHAFGRIKRAIDDAGKLAGRVSGS